MKSSSNSSFRRSVRRVGAFIVAAVLAGTGLVPAQATSIGIYDTGEALAGSSYAATHVRAAASAALSAKLTLTSQEVRSIPNKASVDRGTPGKDNTYANVRIGIAHAAAMADPPVLTTIELLPESVTMQVNEGRIFHATGKDQYGNDCPISDPIWTTSGGGTISFVETSCSYRATQNGDYTITCKQNGTTIEDSSTIHTGPASPVLTTIELLPDAVTMQVNEQRTFTATGKDQYGNAYTISKPVWTTSGGGTLAASGTSCTYTATQVGDFTVTASVPGSPVVGTARAHVGPDDDGDGIRNEVEDGAPNAGDGNADGVPDSLQAHVTSLPAATGRGYITVTTTSVKNQEVWAYTDLQASGGLADPDGGYPYGLVGFAVPCSSAIVTLVFHGATDLSGYTYRKYGRTPDNPSPHWYDFTYDGQTGAVIAGNVVTLYLVDGLRGDDDLLANGVIVEPGGINGPRCLDDKLSVSFGSSGVRLTRDPLCPATTRDFFGCTRVTIQANFRAHLSLRVTPQPGITGTWTGTITPSIVPSGKTSVEVCVQALGVDLSNIPVGQEVKVATVAVLAVPAP